MCDLTHTAHAAAHPFVPCASLSSRPGGRDRGRCAAAGWQPRLSESSLLLYFHDDGNHAFTEHVNRSRRPNAGTRRKKNNKERREAAHHQSCAHGASSAAHLSHLSPTQHESVLRSVASSSLSSSNVYLKVSTGPTAPQ